MFFTAEKLSLRIPEIIAAATRDTRPVEGVLACVAPGAPAESTMAAAPDPDAPGWFALAPGMPWGGAPGLPPDAPQPSIGWNIPANGGGNHWLRATLAVPDEWRGRQVLLALSWEDRGLAGSVEAIVYLDGRALAGIDEFHRAVLLPATAHDGTHELLIRCYTPYRRPFGGLGLQLRDETIFQLGCAMRAMLEAARTFRDADPAGHALLARLNTAYTLLDLREGWQSARFAESARAALHALALEAGEAQPPQPAASSDITAPTLVATGHAHLDVAWLWPLWRTRQKVAHTVATALQLMERYPEYHFSMSQPQVYAFLKEDDPELYARLKARVAEGRFEPVGMMWLEPDCNVTSGESLVRQLVHGARFFNAEFGEQPHVVWLPDVFGYSAALPQLMRGCGISCFMTTKISWNQFNRMPNDTFRWRGIDGSEVLAHFVTATDSPVKHVSEAQFYTYNAMMTGGEVFGTWNHYRQKAINPELLYVYGHGDGGGGPTEGMLEAARVLASVPNFPQVRPGRVDAFFARLYERVWDDPRLPTWVGELYLEFHRGTYTSQARVKQANRANELRLREAEWLNAWAVSLGAADRQPDLDAAWRLILLNQFHDILPGSSIAQVYVDSLAQHDHARQIADDVRASACAFLLAHATAAPEDTSPALPVVWNSLPWPRDECVAVPAALLPHPPATAQRVTSPEGEPYILLPVHVPPSSATPLDSALALAETAAPPAETAASPADAPVPPAETTAPPAETAAQPPETTLSPAETAAQPPATTAPRAHAAAHPAAPLRVTHSTLANDLLHLQLDHHGEIVSLVDRRAGRELVLPGHTLNQLVAYEDRPLRWDAWDIDLFYEEKPDPVRDILAWEVSETGPLRASITITRRLGASTIRQRLSLWRASPRLDIHTTVDWHERQTLLRARFPLQLNATRATCEIQFGAVERPTHRNTAWDVARFEVCAQRWVDVAEGDYGVALLNDGKYGHSLQGSTLGLSLLKGAVFPDPDADRGRHAFTYSLLPHAGDWRAAQVERRAYELNVPLWVAGAVRAPAAGPGWFVRCAAGNVVVETVKVADDGEGIIVRLYEAHNTRGEIVLEFGRAVARADETDLRERPLAPLAVEGSRVRLAVRPCEVKTLRVRF
ncbi:alpha-mannosidase [Kouleothrix sp.]|uniref:alpha-mannosidase n=1 Tax=Kouleothrix sp. TaxID=2779161 RepID=UPI00391C7663